MPTFDKLARFLRDYEKLDEGQRARFKAAVADFVDDLGARRSFRPGLRVKRVRGANGIWEMTWAPDGRATFEYGKPVRGAEPHIVWRRIGTHDVFRQP